MSFLCEIKAELCSVRQSQCCRKAECYGMLLCARAFSLDKIMMQTSSEAAAYHFSKAVRHNFGVAASVISGGSKRTTYRVLVENEIDRKRIMLALGYTSQDNTHNILNDLLLRDCCKYAFLRGVFLSCGALSNPEKDYRLELCVNNADLAQQILDFTAEQNFIFKKAVRSGNTILYMKNSNDIEDFLTAINAANQAIMVMQSKIYRDMRNKVNRIKNCETANIFKAVDAALNQRRAIALLEKRGRLNSLPPELLEAAKLRLENPEATLSELCRISTVPLSRSGLNHRFGRIIQLADELGED